MKRLIGSVILTFLLINIFAQSPQFISYQAVVRNAAGNVLPNKLVTFRISILQGTALGSVIYTETHIKATNEFGLVTLKVGGGTVVTGNFANIDWSLGTYFMKVELDVDAGSNYAFMGTTQILSVPYALYAEKAGNAADDFDKDSLNEIQSINKTGNTVTLSHNGGSFTDSDNQSLSLNGNQLSISGGNTITFTDSVDLDGNPTNELQNLSLIDDTLFISQGNHAVFPHDNDRDSTNELQVISKVGDTIYLSKNGGNVIVTDKQNLSSTSNGTNRTINISNGIGTTFNIADNDNDSLNELQVIGLSNDTLFLSKGNYVIFPTDNDLDSINEIQSLSINYKTLSISKGNALTLNWGPTFINPISLPTLSNNWQVIDVSSSVPQNATSIIISFICNSGNCTFDYRKNSTAYNYDVILGYGAHQITIPIDILRTFESFTTYTGAPPTWKLIAYY